MGKVSIGLRGWRFEESEVFTDAGEFRPLEEIPEGPRERLLRLVGLVEEPCDVCYLEHGPEGKRRWRQATIVYGEPREEVLLCDRHEATFLYWYREAGGREHRGADTFRDAFHEWVAAGNREPEGYAGLEHVETDPETLPDPPDAQAVQEQLTAEMEFEPERIDLREDLERYAAEHAAEADDGEEADDEDADGGDAGDGGDDDRDDPEDLALDDLDLGREYPSG